MFPCILTCQFVSKGILTLIEHTKIWLKSFNDSVVPLTVPVLALKVASRIAIYSSKESRALWRSVACGGKCYIRPEVHCILPPSSFTSEQMLRVERAGPGWADWQDLIHSADLWQEKALLDRAAQATAGSSVPAAGPETPLALRRNEEMKSLGRRKSEQNWELVTGRE